MKYSVSLKAICARLCASMAVSMLCSVALAQNTTVFMEQGQLVRASQNVTSLGADLVGDKVNLYTGALEFNQTDVSLPGNSALPVAVGRRYSAGVPQATGLFLDWDLEIPHLHGVFGTGTKPGWIVTGSTTAAMQQRCSNFGPPPTTGATSGKSGPWDSNEFWGGNFLYNPGSGDEKMLLRDAANTTAPTDGQTYPVVTKSSWQFRCIPIASPSTGEGFLAISPDGTQYRFDWMVSRNYVGISTPLGNMGRREYWILPTLVTDRFGNTVTYAYDAANPWQLNSITANDGRTINLYYSAYNGTTTNVVSSISDGTRTWQYTYASASNRLTRVTLPDNVSSWLFALAEHSTQAPTGNPSAGCSGSTWTDGVYSPSTTASSITHPSGAKATFTFSWLLHGRSNYPTTVCPNNPPTNDTQPATRAYLVRSLMSKSISGPGMADQNWTYDWGPLNASFACTGSCPAYNLLTVTDARNYKTRYTFGNSFLSTEGQLQRLEEGWDATTATALRTTLSYYRLPGAGPYATTIGNSGIDSGDDVMETRNLPLYKKVITQQDVNFTWEVPSTGFDTLVTWPRVTSVIRSSTLPYSKTETTTYSDNKAKWIMGQVASQTVNGITAASTIYDPSTALPTSKYQFGKFQASYIFNLAPGASAGTLNTVTDGASHPTTFTNYKRGLAQTIQYADNSTQSAVVNDLGLVTSLTNEAGTTTGYGYDSSWRLNLITPPSGDPVSYNATSIVFVQVPTAELGIAANHWRQTITTGNAVTINYFDGRWRKLVSTTYDSTNIAGTQKSQLFNYDPDNRLIGQSYPTGSVSSITASLPGTSTVYDELGRPSKYSKSGDSSAINDSNITYLTNFKRQTKDYNGNVSTAGFQAFDQPTESALVSLIAPQGLTLNVSRDAFDKALSMTKSGTNAGVATSVTRSYVYDGYQLLCKTIEPELGATLQDWDPANNMSWRTGGTALTSNSCDRSSVTAQQKISFSYDNRNRLGTTTYGDGSPSIGRTYTADGLPYQTTTKDATTSNIITTWTSAYNNRRLTKSETLTLGTDNYVIGWAYDANGNTSQLTYPDTTNVAYTPNALGQATQVGAYTKAGIPITYWPSGAVAGYTYANNIAHSLTLNTRQLPLQMRDVGFVQDLYAYDANDNVTGITDQQEGLTTRLMGYDGLDRLTSASGFWGQASYGYDVQDNLRSSTVGSRTATHTYDANNRLSSVAGSGVSLSYGYDVNGNITTRAGQTYGFDLGNRMTQATGLSTYGYDGFGRRTNISNGDGSNQVQVYSPAMGKLVYAKNTQGSSPATLTYICPQGQTVSGSTCLSTTTAAASVTGYSCPTNYTLSGTTCTTTTQSTYNATANYGCPAGQTFSNMTCTATSSVPATSVYTCPAGYTLSGQTCSGTTTTTATGTLSCNGQGTLTPYAGSSTGYSCKIISMPTSTNPDAPCNAYAATYGLQYVDAYPSGPKTDTCVLGPVTVYSCPNGGTLSGHSCISPSTVQATFDHYTCSSGTLSGSNCVTTSNSPAQVVSYGCPNGGTVSGQTCTVTGSSSVAATPVYGCPNGGTLINGSCQTTVTTNATSVYSCPNGGTLSAGNVCVGAGSTVPASTTKYAYLGDKLIAVNDTAAGVTYEHTDALGSPVARTNSAGALVSRTRFEPYGNVASGFNPSRPDSVGFTGHVNDPNTGLTYMQQRYYDPIAGRFLSVDPVTTDAGTGALFNRYDYANNSPYVHVDPDGRAPKIGECGWAGALDSCQSVGSLSRTENGKVDPPATAANAPSGFSSSPLTQKQIDTIESVAISAILFVGPEFAPEALIFARTAGVAAKSTVSILEREGNVVVASFKGANGEARVITEMVRDGDKLVLRGTHIEGDGTLKEALAAAKSFGREQGAKQVVIEGGVRTTGANPGRAPRPITIDTGL